MTITHLNQLQQLDRALDWVILPSQVFGPDPKKAKTVFRTLSKKFHPDSIPGDEDDVLAASVFSKLKTLWDSIEMDIYPNPPKMITTTDGYYVTDIKLGSGDIADCRLGKTDARNWIIVKACRLPGDNDLMDNEVETLTALEAAPEYTTMQRYFPKLLHSHLDAAGSRVNILTYFDTDICPPYNLIPLSKIAAYYDNQMQEKQIAWIWRRLLAAVGFAHTNGIIHAGITPDNILIEPRQHGLVLIDWTFSSRHQQVVRSVSAPWADTIYPQDIRDKSAPLPSLDIYMAAQCMKWAGQLSDPLKTYFDWCTTDSVLGRPSKTSLLLEKFDHIIYNVLKWKKEFIPMPNLIDWSQWW